MTGLTRERSPAAFSFALAMIPAAMAAVLTCCWPPAASAQEEPGVLVTASREPESLDQALWSSNILTRPDIEASQTISFQDLLGQLPGVQLDNTGGLGKQSSMFVRGMNADQTLLLINGVRVGSATTGLPPLELIPVDQIERIEVVRGPLSTLYGSDAMGAVIQVFTRDGSKPGFSVDASATGGTYSTFNEALSVHAGVGPVWLDASGESLHTAGFEACSAPPGSPPGDCFGGPPDHDGYLNRSGSFTAGVRWAAGWTATIDSFLTSGHTDYDGTYSDSTEFRERVTSAHLDGRIAGSWTVHATGGRDVDDASDFLAAAPVDRYETRRDTASLQLDGRIVPAVNLIAGSDWQSERIDAADIFGNFISPIEFARSARDSSGTFLELHGSTGPVTELAGVRFEHNTQFGDHVTYDTGAGWRLDRHWRLTATWGTAFHAPTFNDLYYPSFPGFPPPSNPNLLPETSRSVELGIAGQWATYDWSLRVYQTDVDHLITYAPPDYTPYNLAAARIRGIELHGAWRHEDWTLSGQVTGLDPRDHSPAAVVAPGTAGNLLPRRAQSSAFVDLQRSLFGRVSVSARGRWEGRRFDDLANTVPLGGYFLLDFLADARLGSGWSIEGRISNALGRTYYTAAAIASPPDSAFYNQPGRELDLTLRYRFDDSPSATQPR
ncbi:MAG: TonB-dependent receptor [Gammaproteobacteria bacterium]|nr:TonB-dependent receptor [Gammaproteobacteria bacterium]